MAKPTGAGGEGPGEARRPAASGAGEERPRADAGAGGTIPQPVNVDEDPIVAAVVGDPCLPANVWTARGFPGRSCSNAHLRIYLTVELDEYLEIPREAVRHAVQCDHECAGLGGVLVWIDRAASVQHVRSREVRAPAGPLPRRDEPRGAWSEEDWDDGDPNKYSKRC
jgi:hypothetical protein